MSFKVHLVLLYTLLVLAVDLGMTDVPSPTATTEELRNDHKIKSMGADFQDLKLQTKAQSNLITRPCPLCALYSPLWTVGDCMNMMRDEYLGRARGK